MSCYRPFAHTVARGDIGRVHIRATRAASNGCAPARPSFASGHEGLMRRAKTSNMGP
jgi:hypothetical protein